METMQQIGPSREYTLRFLNMKVAHAFSASFAKAYTRVGMRPCMRTAFWRDVFPLRVNEGGKRLERRMQARF